MSHLKLQKIDLHLAKFFFHVYKIFKQKINNLVNISGLFYKEIYRPTSPRNIHFITLAVYLTMYQVVVKTGSVDGAGTDADVYIRINGTTGYIEKELETPGDDFEEGR